MSFKSQALYNLTSKIQNNTLLNRGLLDVGGIAAPQMIMSNNKDEVVERGVMSGMYFASSFLAPFALLPFFNKTFLAKNGIVKNFANKERQIIEVSKEYLVKDAKFMVEGIRKTAKSIEEHALKKGKSTTVVGDFEAILEHFDGRHDELKSKLLKAHEQVYISDFLSTGLMWCAVPWIAAAVTKLRTNRSGYSATYSMVDESKSKQNAQAHEKNKTKKLLTSLALATVPSVLAPKLVSAGLNAKGKSLNYIQKHAASFNYSKGIFPSKLIFGLMWVLCDYPSTVVSARDKYERKDRALRSGSILVAFFGGDFILNNVLGRLSDRVLKTSIMERENLPKDAGFFQKLKMQPKSFEKIDDLKSLSPEILSKTKKIGAGLYWATLLANMAILGLGVPAFLNKMLKTNIKKDSQAASKAPGS